MLASVDPPAVQLAMNATWHLPFRWVSDPDGEQYAKPLEAWNADGELFRPLLQVVGPDGTTAFRELSRDFTDRPDDETLLSTVEGLGLPALREPAPWAPDGVEPQPSERWFKPRSFVTYFRAIRANTSALAARMVDDADRATVQGETAMAASFLDAFDDWRRAHPEN